MIRKPLMAPLHAQLVIVYMRKALQAINVALSMPQDSIACGQTRQLATAECEKALGILRTMQPPLRWKHSTRDQLRRAAFEMRVIARKPRAAEVFHIHNTVDNLARKVSALKPFNPRR